MSAVSSSTSSRLTFEPRVFEMADLNIQQLTVSISTAQKQDQVVLQGIAALQKEIDTLQEKYDREILNVSKVSELAQAESNITRMKSERDLLEMGNFTEGDVAKIEGLNKALIAENRKKLALKEAIRNFDSTVIQHLQNMINEKKVQLGSFNTARLAAKECNDKNSVDIEVWKKAMATMKLINEGQYFKKPENSSTRFYFPPTTSDTSRKRNADADTSVFDFDTSHKRPRSEAPASGPSRAAPTMSLNKAINDNRVDLVRLSLAAGVKYNEPDATGIAPIFAVLMSGYRNGDIIAALEAKEDLDFTVRAPEKYNKATTLMVAAEMGWYGAVVDVVKAFEKLPQLLQAKDTKGNNALDYAKNRPLNLKGNYEEDREKTIRYLSGFFGK